VFKYFLISITFVPLLLGVYAAQSADATRGRWRLRVGWFVYAFAWFGVLYYLKRRWGWG
jgi:hypothetical protein